MQIRLKKLLEHSTIFTNNDCSGAPETWFTIHPTDWGKILAVLERRSQKVGAIQTRKEARKIADRCKNRETLAWFYKKLEEDNFYIDENKYVTGWWNPNKQIIAERLPLIFFQNIEEDEEEQSASPGTIVEFSEFLNFEANYKIGSRELWEARGFAEAVPLLLVTNILPDGAKITEVCRGTHSIQWLAQHGYAEACSLQWMLDRNVFTVYRNIHKHGFAVAWDCTWVKAEAHFAQNPELFEDLDWWDFASKARYEPINDPYAAVLGTGNTLKT